uniref:Uncharacterized protein n=1 Tax=Tanacetum cinerariifolium TaxID=118510 RepID=A0A699QJ60_TANCI|nr:hypothetical protein [Tanacetum cinerariifolium]
MGTQQPTLDVYNIYGDEQNFSYKRSRGMFIPTRTESNMKHRHIENNIISDIFSFAFHNPMPCTIMVLTGNEKYSWVIHVLERMAYRMIVWFSRRMGHLELASTAATICDWNNPSERFSTPIKSQRIDGKSPSKKDSCNRGNTQNLRLMTN